MIEQQPEIKDILVVDDNPTNLRLLAHMLSEQGYKVRPASTGARALVAARSAPPNLILLDIDMPEMNGYEVCQQLKSDEQTCDIPIIFISALDDVENKVKAFTVGGVDYVTKPFKVAEVLARVKTHLQIQDLTRSLQMRNAQLQRFTYELRAANERITRFNEQLELTIQQRTNQLTQAYQMLEQLDRTKTSFLQVASHELRTPLTAIVGYTQILEEESLIDDPEVKTMLGCIVQGAGRLAEIIDGMFDMACIDAGTLAVHKIAVALSEIVEQVRRPLEAVLRERNLTLTVGGLDDLPPIEADPNLLYKTFYHLVTNAVKYTPNGGAITVSGQVVSGEGQTPAVEIVISDTGIGIDPAHQDLVFKNFYQIGQAVLHSSGKTKFKGGGPGLGLAIARGIVLAHGGHIRVESPGYDEQTCPGSRFYVRLPIGTPDNSPLAYATG